MGSTRPMWVGLGWTYVMSWVGLNFFLSTMVGWVKKSLQPDPCTPLSFTMAGFDGRERETKRREIES